MVVPLKGNIILLLFLRHSIIHKLSQNNKFQYRPEHFSYTSAISNKLNTCFSLRFQEKHRRSVSNLALQLKCSCFLSTDFLYGPAPPKKKKIKYKRKDLADAILLIFHAQSTCQDIIYHE